MPKRVTIRLTDPQHAELAARAAHHHRTMQKQLIHDLFPPADVNAPAGTVTSSASAATVTGVKYPGRRTYRGPDPKPEKGKK